MNGEQAESHLIRSQDRANLRANNMPLEWKHVKLSLGIFATVDGSRGGHIVADTVRNNYCMLHLMHVCMTFLLIYAFLVYSQNSLI